MLVCLGGGQAGYSTFKARKKKKKPLFNAAVSIFDVEFGIRNKYK